MEVRRRVDEIVQRLGGDEDFKARMYEDPEGTLMEAGFGEEAAVILADDWRGISDQAELICQVNKSCRFTDSKDPCGWTATSLRSCAPSVRCSM